jgi:hypothetical protein
VLSACASGAAGLEPGSSAFAAIEIKRRAIAETYRTMLLVLWFDTISLLIERQLSER